jgi:hypothetical protein
MNLTKLAFQIDSVDGSQQKAMDFMIFHGLAQSSINCKNGHECKNTKVGANSELNQGPPAPKAGIIPLDH